MDHHPIFAGFPQQTHENNGNFEVGFLGARTRVEFLPVQNPSPSRVHPPIPPYNEEYFEWIDVLEAANLAVDTFTMLELGAGYGRWAVRGALAARAKGISNIRIGVAEAEGQHLIWLHQHLQDNGISSREYEVYDCAVSDQEGTVPFYVSMPEGSAGNSANEWYGQCKAMGYDEPCSLEPVGDYCGKPVIAFRSGYRAVMVPQRPCKEILMNYSHIDLVDMDVQGEEFKIVQSSICELNAVVQRLHIGTHSHEIEKDLFQLLSHHRWVCINNYPCQSTNATPYGQLEFVDGVQTWLNPKYLPKKHGFSSWIANLSRYFTRKKQPTNTCASVK